jgi:hypothetical protein
MVLQLIMVSRFKWSAGLDGPSCIPSVRGKLLLWMHSSVMLQVLWVDLAVEGAVGRCAFRCTDRADVEAVYGRLRPCIPELYRTCHV